MTNSVKKARKPDTRKKPGPKERARIKAEKEAALTLASAPAKPAKPAPAATPVAKKVKSPPTVAPKPVATPAASTKKNVLRSPEVHEGEEDVVPPKRVKVKKAKPEAVGDKTMGHSFQRGGVVAKGITIKGGGTQLTVTLTAAQAEAVGAKATGEGVSMSEAIRRLVNDALAR